MILNESHDFTFLKTALKCWNTYIEVESNGEINSIEEASHKISYLKRQYFLQV